MYISWSHILNIARPYQDYTTLNRENIEKWSVITCATLLVLHPSLSPNPSSFLHIPPSLLPPSVSVRQLAGLLPVKLHERTGGSTFLLNIALHSGDSLPCLSLSYPLFVCFHSCTVTWSYRLHFNLTHSSSCLLLFSVFNQGKKDAFLCAEVQHAIHYHALMA